MGGRRALRSATTTGESVRRSGGAGGGPALHGPLPAQPTTFPLGQSTPDPELLAVGQGVLEAVLTDHATSAHLLRLTGGRTPLGKEQIGVDPHAVGLRLPTALLGPVHQ